VKKSGGIFRENLYIFQALASSISFALANYLVANGM